MLKKLQLVNEYREKRKKNVKREYLDRDVGYQAEVDLSGFNVGLELRKWAIADSLGFIPKDEPETSHRNFDSPGRR